MPDYRYLLFVWRCGTSGIITHSRGDYRVGPILQSDMLQWMRRSRTIPVKSCGDQAQGNRFESRSSLAPGERDRDGFFDF
jgi:hypothetical protein